MNRLEIRFSALLENVGFARTSVASFVSSLNPTIDEVQEIKTMCYGFGQSRSMFKDFMNCLDPYSQC